MSIMDILLMEARNSKIFLVIEEGSKKLEAFYMNNDYVTEILINRELVERYVGETSLRREIKKFSAQTIRKVVDEIKKEQERFDIPKKRLLKIAEEIASGEKLAYLTMIINICCTSMRYTKLNNSYYASDKVIIRLTDTTLYGILGNLHLQKVVIQDKKQFEYPVMSEKNLLLELMNGVK